MFMAIYITTSFQSYFISTSQLHLSNRISRTVWLDANYLSFTLWLLLHYPRNFCWVGNALKAERIRKYCYHLHPRPLHFLHIGKSSVYVTIYLLVKILFLTFKAYYKTGPKYLTDTLIKYMPSRKLRSASKELLVE